MTIYGATSADAPKFDQAAHDYDAVLIMSFGGPDGPDDVVPFLENVTRGRGIPRERLAEVGEHYYQFGGVSPINEQNLALIAALEAELKEHGPDLPIYYGNRNWHPYIEDTLRQMRDDGVKRAITFVTSAISSYSGCRQYREDLIEASEAVEGAPVLDKLRTFYNHPGFIEPVIEHTQEALEQFAPDVRDSVRLVFTAHSVPLGMAKNSDYEAQLHEASRLVAQGVGRDSYSLVYQSRSGPPQMPWLEPDICDYLREIKASEGIENVVMVPIGFISDHMEVLFDLDTEAMAVAEEIGMKLVRVATVGTHPKFISMIRELILERMTENPVRRALGNCGPNHDICPLDCCLKGSRPKVHAEANS
ncbi:ferrochelatase [Phototrophicus methaneseepsis]|uniref:Ferrochelatase n=1 Tax=Phototrophicus methaneseepsis TaxID=2710758 RepID=A0A7S8EBX7_9CHLR|nr:ferrochelatase [Phototrophicus methaneseepsis]QPC84099.1 ferrochelatase [Phototrophicus methaneseepsis]